MMNKPTLLVLAAGMGSRYGGLKQIDSVGSNGETIIDYSVYDALRAGFGKLVFVIRRDMEVQFKAVVGARFEKSIQVEYVFQELDQLPPEFVCPSGRTKPWGTTQAILMARNVVKEPFAAINADDFYGADSFRIMVEHLYSDSPHFAMVGFVLRNTLSEFGSVARGVCETTPDGLLKSVVERTKIEPGGNGIKFAGVDGKIYPLTGDELVSMNLWGFTPMVFPLLHERFVDFLKKHGREEKSECYIPTAINDLIAAGQARTQVLRTNASWFGVTYYEDRSNVVESIRALVAQGSYPDKLWP
jgi:dTDP-glucose pyrophosphorylase